MLDTSALPPPQPGDADALDALAADMVAQARSGRDPRMFAATGFARQNISIVHQQLRCSNLAWALDRLGIVSAGTVVGVIGGSISGLTLAVNMALRSAAVVYVFESSNRLLDRFLDKSHRHLSPVLNSRFLGKRYDPSSATAEFPSPVFAWAKGSASEVAHQWLEEFGLFERRLPIFTLAGRRIEAGDLDASFDKVWLMPPASFGDHRPIGVDLLIDATGFGEEVNRHKVVDYSYWEGGHRLIYDHLGPKSRVLLSGCGDSGVIEGLHYAAEGFRHDDVEALWTSHSGLEAVLDEGVSKARLDDIFQRSDAETWNVVPEICWWHQTRSQIVRNGFKPWAHGGPDTRPIYDAIDVLMRPVLLKRYPGADLDQLDAEAVEALLDDGVDPALQVAVRNAVDPIAERIISRNLKAFADQLDALPQLEALRAMARPGLDLVLNGRMPTAYTRELSPYNVWLMRLLLEMPNVRYRPGTIRSVQDKTKVVFEDGAQETFDRVITRYGASGAGLFAPSDPAAVARDPLLDQVYYNAATDGRAVFPMREGLARARDALAARPVPPASALIPAQTYTLRLALKPEFFATEDDTPIDLEADLIRSLRAGEFPGFLTQAEIARTLRRR